MSNSRWKSLGISDDEDLLIELLMHLREEGGSFEDEILLHWRPVTDLSKRSLLLLWIVSEC